MFIDVVQAPRSAPQPESVAIMRFLEGFSIEPAKIGQFVPQMGKVRLDGVDAGNRIGP
jgi:hypothetical protein